jgi:hypothetical protein
MLNKIYLVEPDLRTILFVPSDWDSFSTKNKILLKINFIPYQLEMAEGLYKGFRMHKVRVNQRNNYHQQLLSHLFYKCKHTLMFGYRHTSTDTFEEKVQFTFWSNVGKDRKVSAKK